MVCGMPAATAGQPGIRSVVRADAQGRLIRAVVRSGLSLPREMAGVSEMVEEAAKRHDVDPLLVHSMIQVESNYNPYALSPKGAQGLMQLMPATARRFGVRNSFDVKENIEGGVRYLKYLESLFPNEQELIIAAYNAGEGAVWKYGNKIPPYRETEQYVVRVGTRYGNARRTAASKKKAPELETAQAAPTSAPEQVYAPVQAFVDEQGRLHLRTVHNP